MYRMMRLNAVQDIELSPRAVHPGFSGGGGTGGCNNINIGQMQKRWMSEASSDDIAFRKVTTFLKDDDAKECVAGIRQMRQDTSAVCQGRLSVENMHPVADETP